MTKFPIQLPVKCILPGDKQELLTCTALLRSIPGTRDVYDAFWNDKAVIVKVFSHKLKQKHHVMREWKGLDLLMERRLHSIMPLFYGRTDDGGWAVVTEKVLDSRTALAVFDKMTDKAGRLDLLVLICEEVARQHERGILQKDLHLGNFLISGKQVFALDPGQMRFFSKPISRKGSLSQLAVLSCYLPEDDIAALTSLRDAYFRFRDWRLLEQDERFLKKERTEYKKRAVRKGLRKVLRTSTRYQRIKSGNYSAVIDRAFLSNRELPDFIRRIDMLMDAGKVLKNGNTCYVSRVLWNNKKIVVKRYNHKSLMHSMRYTMKGSRARRSWLYGHQLRMLDIGTPKPLAYIEQRRGLLLWNSYLVTEYIEAENLYNFLRDDTVSEGDRAEVIQKIMGLIHKMERHCISHGDLKHTNILINREPVLTDLDSMRASKWRWLRLRRHVKDIRRFNEGFETSTTQPST